MQTAKQIKKQSIEVPTLLDPKLYRLVEALARNALLFAENHPAIRNDVGALCHYMRDTGTTKFGMETVDSRLLSDLLMRTRFRLEEEHPPRPPADRDMIKDLSEQRGRREPQLTPEQVGAAVSMRNVWNAMARMLTFRMNKLDGVKGGGYYRIRSPVELMGENAWSAYQEKWVPWFNDAKRRTEPSKREISIPHTSIVSAIVFNHVKPRLLDKIRTLDRGTSLRVLQDELDSYANQGS